MVEVATTTAAAAGGTRVTTSGVWTFSKLTRSAGGGSNARKLTSAVRKTNKREEKRDLTCVDERTERTRERVCVCVSRGNEKIGGEAAGLASKEK